MDMALSPLYTFFPLFSLHSTPLRCCKAPSSRPPPHFILIRACFNPWMHVPVRISLLPCSRERDSDCECQHTLHAFHLLSRALSGIRWSSACSDTVHEESLGSSFNIICYSGGVECLWNEKTARVEWMLERDYKVPTVGKNATPSTREDLERPVFYLSFDPKP